MTSRIIILLTLIFFALNMFGQPGGGGGLEIFGFYNKQLEKININDTSFKVRIFALAVPSINSKIIQEIYSSDCQYLVPSFSNYSTDNYIDLTNQRMFIIYMNDTMIIDFIGIMHENGMGNFDRMDSVIFQRGHFRYFRYSNSVSQETYHVQNLYSLFSNGLTPYTCDYLSKITFTVVHSNNDTIQMLKSKFTADYFLRQNEKNNKQSIIDYTEKINASFLLESNLPAIFYLRRGANYMSQKNYELALADIFKSIQMGLNPKEQEEYLLLLCNVYDQQKNYDIAIKYISDLIKIRSKPEYYAFYNDNGLEHIKDSYRMRIDLFIKKKQFDRALVDFDSLVSISKYYFNFSNSNGYVLTINSEYALSANIERAMFKISYLKDYKGALFDLKENIKSIPDNHLNDRPQGWSEYSDTYFILAIAEYYNGNKKSAFHHWLKAMEYGYAQTSGDYAVIHFDSIIKQNPKISELYLSRALAYYKRASYLGWGDLTKECLKNSLTDINKAEELGLTDFRINLYKAVVLNQLKRYNEAMKEINLAITKNKFDPRCYLARYEIRNNLGNINWGDKSDTDIQMYRDLCKKWKFNKN